MSRRIEVDVIYALPHEQRVLPVCVEEGVTTVREAVIASGLLEEYPELAVQPMHLGMYGKEIHDADKRCLQAGDRIEILRPLLIDPKDSRRQRVAQARAGRQKQS